MAIGTLLEKLLSVWSIPSMMLLSLSVQVVLNFASPFRRTSRTWAPAIVWSAYLLSDSVAIFTTGLISNTVRTSSTTPLLINQDLLALWASILLVHMGGPNTITAYSLEDNSLWLRHVVRLVSQLAVTCYILLKTSVENNILVPTLVMLLLGMVRYSERIRALYLASLVNMKVSVCGKRLIEQLPEEDISVSYYFYERFRGMIVDIIMPDPSELELSRQFFMETSPEKALKVISRELHMMYEELYTKIAVRNSSLGLFITVMYTCLVVAAIVFFYLSGRNRLDGVDGKITGYMVSGIGLITYDWVFMSGFSAMSWVPELKGFVYLLFKWLVLKFESGLILNRAWSRISGICQLNRAWSRRLGAFNLLDCSIKHHLKRNKRKNKAIRCCGDLLDKAIKWCGLNDWFDKMTHTTTEHLPDELWHFIFAGLQQKASDIHNEEQAREVYESKGEAVLQEKHLPDLEKSYMKDFDYGKAVLCWHIATEICYNVDKNEDDVNRKWSKILSDYLTYLLIHQPKLTASVAGITQERYDHTCLEVKASANKLGVENLKDFCAKALEVRDEENGESRYTGEPEEERNHDAETGGCVLHGKSVFHDACNLARILRKHDNRWEIIAEVWAEMFSYGAGHCRGNEHARTVSRGGELLTHVWLLMAHFGITAQWPKN